MQTIGHRLWKSILWLNRFCFESVLVSVSAFSILYALRTLILDSLYSFDGGPVILVERVTPIELISFTLVLAGIVNIVSLYLDHRLLLAISLYALLFVWALLMVSFVLIDPLSLHSLISSYLTVIYSWALWRSRGLTFLNF